jgi:uncharacterized protein
LKEEEVLSPIEVILLVIALIVAILAVSSFYFYNVGIARKKKDFLKGNPDLEVDAPDHAWDSARDWMEKQQVEKINMKAEDGLNLAGYYMGATETTDKTVILVHGYTSKAMDMGAFARFYHEELGFNVLMADNRGHGLSEGNYIGFGWHDRLDYLKWIKLAIEKSGNSAQIVLHGVSMGGATVLMVSGEELPENVKCIVCDCAYTSAKDILSYQMKRMYKLPDFPLIPATSLLCKLRAGYFVGEASALKQVAKAKAPILFIHGEEDAFVPTEMVHSLYEECRTEKELFLVPKAGHGNAFFTDKEGYKKRVVEFAVKYMK